MSIASCRPSLSDRVASMTEDDPTHPTVRVVAEASSRRRKSRRQPRSSQAVLVLSEDRQMPYTISLDAIVRAVKDVSDGPTCVPTSARAALLLEFPTEPPNILVALRSVGSVAQAAVRSRTRFRPWVALGPMDDRSLTEVIKELRRAIRSAAMTSGGPKVILVQDVLPLWAIEADRGIMARLSAVLAPLASLDSPRQSALVQTLHAYLDNDLSDAATARHLGIHRHTLEYRIRKIEASLGLSLARASDRFLLEAALYARRLSSRGPGA